MNEDDLDLIHVGNSVRYKIIDGVAILVTAQFPFGEGDDDGSTVTELWPSSLADELMPIYEADRESFEAQILRYGEMMMESALIRLKVQQFHLGADPTSAANAQAVSDTMNAAALSILEAFDIALQVAASIDDHSEKEAGQGKTLSEAERISPEMLTQLLGDLEPPRNLD